MFGTPVEDKLPEVQSYPNFKKTFPKFKAEGLHDHFPDADKELVDFMGKFLELNRMDRISAYEALQHPIFKKLTKD